MMFNYSKGVFCHCSNLSGCVSIYQDNNLTSSDLSKGTDSMNDSYILLFLALFFTMSLRKVARSWERQTLEVKILSDCCLLFSKWPHGGATAALTTWEEPWLHSYQNDFILNMDGLHTSMCCNCGLGGEPMLDIQEFLRLFWDYLWS